MLFSYLPFFSVSRGGYRAREMMLHYRVQIASNKRWFQVNTLKFVLLCCDLKGDWFVSPLFAIGTAGYVQPQTNFYSRDLEHYFIASKIVCCMFLVRCRNKKNYFRLEDVSSILSRSELISMCLQIINLEAQNLLGRCFFLMWFYPNRKWKITDWKSSNLTHIWSFSHQYKLGLKNLVA